MKKTTKTINESKKCSTTANDETVAENFQRIENQDDFYGVEFKTLDLYTIDFSNLEEWDDIPL